MIKRLRQRLRQRLGEETFFFAIVGTIAIIIIVILDIARKPSPDDVLVEAHGMLFDIILFGVILSIYDRSVSKKRELERKGNEKMQKVERYQEEIGDFRGWNEVEATYRIVGNMKRLNALNVTEIDGVNCYLKEANLTGLNLEGANLRFSNLKEAYAWNCNFSNANMQNADMRGLAAMIMGYNEVDKYLANFSGAKLEKCKAYQYQKDQLVECGASKEEIDKMIFYENPNNLIQSKWGFWTLDKKIEE